MKKGEENPQENQGKLLGGISKNTVGKIVIMHIGGKKNHEAGVSGYANRRGCGKVPWGKNEGRLPVRCQRPDQKMEENKVD